MNLDDALKVTKEIIIKEGDWVLSTWGSSKIAKTKDRERLDIATEADQEAEKRIVTALKTEFPSSGFQVEEGKNENMSAEYQWVIDPIDGTKWFASSVPLFCTSIGLMCNGVPVLGAIYNPVTRQLYTGSIQAEAELNGRPIHISSIDTLARSMVSADYSRIAEEWERDGKEVTEKIARITDKAYRVRVIGSGALSLAWIAQGSIMNAFVTLAGGTKLTDVAAGLAICKAAGATVLAHPHANGKTDYILARETVAKELENLLW